MYILIVWHVHMHHVYLCEVGWMLFSSTTKASALASEETEQERSYAQHYRLEESLSDDGFMTTSFVYAWTQLSKLSGSRKVRVIEECN